MRPPIRAFLDSDIDFGVKTPMPRGEYFVERGEDITVHFRQGAAAFAMTLDAVIMHVIEGRMRLIGGRLI